MNAMRNISKDSWSMLGIYLCTLWTQHWLVTAVLVHLVLLSF